MHRFMLVVMVFELFCPSGFAQNTSSPNAPSFSAEDGRFASFDFPFPASRTPRLPRLLPRGRLSDGTTPQMGTSTALC